MNPVTDAAGSAVDGDLHGTRLLIIVCVALVSSLLVLGVAARRPHQGFDQKHLNLMGFVTLGFLGVIATLVLPDQKGAAALGLLGALAGFIANKSGPGSSETPAPPASPKP